MPLFGFSLSPFCSICLSGVSPLTSPPGPLSKLQLSTQGKLQLSLKTTKNTNFTLGTRSSWNISGGETIISQKIDKGTHQKQQTIKLTVLVLWNLTLIEPVWHAFMYLTRNVSKCLRILILQNELTTTRCTTLTALKLCLTYTCIQRPNYNLTPTTAFPTILNWNIARIANADPVTLSQAQFFAKFFSTQNSVNRNKTDFATKRRKSQENQFLDKTS